MMASKISIWNLALARVKVSALIQAEDEGSTESNACLTVWDNSLKSTLELFDWPFAKARVALAKLVEDPPPEWTYRYQYPADCVAARYIPTPSGVEAAYPFELVLDSAGASMNLLCDLDDAELVYTKNISNPALFSGSFVEALSWKLGAEIGPQLGVSEKRLAVCEAAFVTALQRATIHSIDQGANRDQGDAAHIAARE